MEQREGIDQGSVNRAGPSAHTEEMDLEQRPGPGEEDEQVQEAPVPPDAPVETPEADPRTEGAPDSEDSGSRPNPPNAAEEQIQEAFE